MMSHWAMVVLANDQWSTPMFCLVISIQIYSLMIIQIHKVMTI